MNHKTLRRALAIAVTGMAATLTVQAHPCHGVVHGLSTGFVHPFTGADHILAMVAVGLLAVQRGGRSLFLFPLSFMAAMAGGWLAAMAGMTLPFVEVGIVLSVLTLGLLITTEPRLSGRALLGVIALFGLAHGHAHGLEAAGGAARFGLGFLAGTALLHLGGISAGLLLKQVASQPLLVRVAGAAIFLGGCLLVLA